MKNLTNVLLFALLVMSLFSCKDETPLNLEDDIVGDWAIHSFVINSCPNADLNVPEMVAEENGCLGTDGEMECTTIDFAANGLGEIRTKSFFGSAIFEDTQNFTYQFNKESGQINLCMETDDCIDLYIRDGELFNEMDEEGCICIFEFHKE